MIDDLKAKQAGVICLHCGRHTPLPISVNQGRLVEGFAVLLRRLSIVRCSSCGKEGPYLASDVIVPAEMPVNVSVAA